MSDYTKVGTWTNVAKSGATIYAADFDAEFTALETAISSKADSSGVTDVSGLFSVQIFTSSGTWTKPSGIKKVIVEVQGAGSSGTDGQSSSTRSCSGGAGGYVKKLIDVSSISSATVTIGSGGAGVSGYPSNAGGDSIWSDGTNTLTGGGAGAAGTGDYYGGAGGTATGGDLNIVGQHGGGAGPRQGADSMLGLGGTRGSTSGYSQDSYDPTGYGSGSAGLYAHSAGGSTKNGKGGVVIVWEYK